jgi:hypothetical protein
VQQISLKYPLDIPRIAEHHYSQQCTGPPVRIAARQANILSRQAFENYTVVASALVAEFR